MGRSRHAHDASADGCDGALRLAYLITGDQRLGQEAKRRILHFFAWDPEGTTSFFAYDEPPMWMMMRGTRAYDWTYDLFTADERSRVEANMRVRAAQFYQRLQQLPFESRPYDSHAGRLPGFLGECTLSFIHEWPEARDWMRVLDAVVLHVVSGLGWRRRRMARRTRLLGSVHAVRPALRRGAEKCDGR